MTGSHVVDGPVVALTGRVDARGAGQLRRVLYDQLERWDHVVVDLADVPGVDVVALRVLAEVPEGEELEPSTVERDRLDLAASSARTAETELRLALRTREERARAIKGRAESLEGAARNELAARERLRQRRERRAREAEIAQCARETRFERFCEAGCAQGAAGDIGAREGGGEWKWEWGGEEGAV